jgi:hypothetical protein
VVWGIDFSPKGTEALYRERNGKLLIELELNTVMQIFNSLDPAPFRGKSLIRKLKNIFIILLESSL